MTRILKIDASAWTPCLVALLLLVAACSRSDGPDADAGADALTRTTESTVRYEFYRNATAKLYYAGQTFLLDPMLSPKGALPSFAGIAPNPTVELPVPVDDITAGVDAVIVGHMHPDHFDPAAAELLDAGIPIYTPNNAAPVNPQDPVNTTSSFYDQLTGLGFTNVLTIGSNASNSTTIHNITLTEEFGQHGSGVLSDLMGGVNGLVFEAPGSPTIYWTGDTILDEEGRVAAILSKYQPDIIIAHTGGAVLEAISPDPLLMDAEQAVKFFEAAKRANDSVNIVAVHMNALDHCFTTRDDLRDAISVLSPAFRENISIPTEGDIVAFD